MLLLFLVKESGLSLFLILFMAKNALQQDHLILGKKVDVKPAEPQIQISNRKIFVGGLPPNIKLEEFKEYFGSYGTITDAVIIYDKETHNFRGFGFVTYDSEEAAENVLQKNFHELNNKMVEVKRAKPKDQMKNDCCRVALPIPWGIYDFNFAGGCFFYSVGCCFWVQHGYGPRYGSYYQQYDNANSNYRL
ncbi:hypothetical protein REPUB_Repub10bG0126200 [Reevesia pubescens]